ncbi:MAG TPA: hypothetical protein VF585_12040 [Chthoniobacterales bacterium]|jgi:hypothetical protein
MKINAVLIVTACSVLVGCGQAPPNFDELAASVRRNRNETSIIISAIQKQPTLQRLIWSDGNEFITIIGRDGEVADGYREETKWQPEIQGWIKRLKASGCHGFDDDREIGLTRLYLDIQTYIAVTSPGPFREKYSAWSRAGETDEGYSCIDLGQGWYLTAENE